MDNLKQKLIGLLVGFEVALFGCVYFFVLGKGSEEEGGKTTYIILGVVALLLVLATIGAAFYLTKHILLPNKFKAPSNGVNDFLDAFRGNKKPKEANNKKGVPPTRASQASGQAEGKRPSGNPNRTRLSENSRATGAQGVVVANAKQGEERPRNTTEGTRRPRPTNAEAGRPRTATARPRPAVGEEGRQRPTRQRPTESGRPSSSRPRPTNGDTGRTTAAGRPSEGARRPRPTNPENGGRPRG